MSDKNLNKDPEAEVGADTADGIAHPEEGAQADAAPLENGVVADVNDDIAAADAADATDNADADTQGDADVNEAGVDALDISFAADIAFEPEPDADALLAADATDATGTADATDATDATANEDAAEDEAEDAQSAGNAEPGSKGANADADGEASESAPAIASMREEAIVSSRIDAEVRRRRGIVAPGEYPVYALSDVTVARAKTGDPIIEHVDCAFFNGYVNAILVDSDEERQTVMALLAGLAMPTVGQVLYRSKPLYEYDMHEYRGHEVGFVFQRYNLRPDLSALRNVILAMDASGRNFLKSKTELAKQRLAEAGFPDDRLDVPVRDLDVAQLRRAEIARALCCEANMLILDEPTGGLSKTDADDVMALLARQVSRKDRCVIIVTERESVAARCDSSYPVNDLASAGAEE